MSIYETLDAAISAYFHAQRLVATIGLVVALLTFAVALVMLSFGDAFVRGLSVVLIVIALATGGLCATLAVRYRPHADSIVRVRSSFSVAREAARIERRIDRYRYYHVALAGVACVAVMLLLVTFAPTWQGVAVGMLLLAGFGITLEHFDRQQAIVYLAALKPSRCL
jgi:MFS family permease